ncbi:MAG TPA: acyltransferase [Aliidongia sp.]|uniref:acyltransferase family protein n=1 Tax=Aliidongia sp. TaxID=1914230 RepID=UPI002DDCBCAE|nr:acyltransferase [Aliidongia sp.]HEV2676648.1 acyltransferase [Aliidongia sp.]
MPGTTKKKPHLLYIDCLRGYAILMVIACHLTYEFPDLPYPVKIVTTSGWFGVQLFFLASAVTLLMSWHSEAARGVLDVRAFFIRRFFRIAPAYYAAGILYFFAFPPEEFSVAQIARTATFVNALSPAWLTAPDAWSVVPGGWSISVEFTFYLLFPIFATVVDSFRRSLLALALCVGVGTGVNLAALAILSPHYPAATISNFLFFWFPNEAAVFALGGVVFFALRALQVRGDLHAVLARWSTALALVSILAFCTLAYLPLGHFMGDRPPIPAGQAVSLPLAGLVLALSANRSLLVSRPVAAMGKVSFSAYLLHFFVLEIFRAFPGTLHTQVPGVAAIAAYAVGFAVTVLLTFAASWVSYETIEAPMIRVGRRLIDAMQRGSATPKPETGVL